MTRKSMTVRIPNELAEEVETVARVREVSVNTLILDALQSEVNSVRRDEEFMRRLQNLVERDRAILDRLAQ